MGEEDKFISPESLDVIISFLPDPNSINIRLIGPHSYNDLENQMYGLVPNLKLKSETVEAEIKNPSKQALLYIYNQIYNARVPVWAELQSKEEFNAVPHIDLKEAKWERDSIEIAITPTSVTITYRDKLEKDPNLEMDIFEIKSILKGTGVKIIEKE